MDLEFIRVDIGASAAGRLRGKQREILDLQRAGISTKSTEELLARMQSKVQRALR